MYWLLEIQKPFETPGIPHPYWKVATNQIEGNTMECFLKHHQDHIRGVLSGFDRVVFRGTLRSISHVKGMETFLNVHHVLLKDFGSFVEAQSSLLKTHAQKFAQDHKRPYKYIVSASRSKADIAKEIMHRDGIEEGLICVLSCVELCMSYTIRRDRDSKTIHLESAPRKCLHLYFYFIDHEFGFMHVRLQSWFPFPIQVCINGREWLARDLDKAGISYQRRDNCFIEIADINKAQELADAAIKRNWLKLLDRFSDRFNPLLKSLDIRSYYWTIREGEYATDVMFKDPNYLKSIYPHLIHHAIEHFHTTDVIRFFGKYADRRFHGEVSSNICQREEGVRIKHWVDENSVKMYDKQGQLLRIETTINNPRRFKVYRSVERDGRDIYAWRALRKGIADIWRRVQISHKANSAYLDALAVVEHKKPVYQYLDRLAKPVYKKNRRYRGLRPIHPEEAKWFRVMLNGKFLIYGFRNTDLRSLIFSKPKHPKEKEQQMGKVTRLLKLMCAHGLIRKMPRTHRYRITQKGQLTMSTAMSIRNSSLSQLEKAA